MRGKIVLAQFCLLFLLLALFVPIARVHASYQWRAHEYIHNIDILEYGKTFNEISIIWIRLEQGFDLRHVHSKVCWLIKEQDAKNINIRDLTFHGDFTINQIVRNSSGTYVYFKWAPYSWQGWINRGGLLGIQFTYETTSLTTKEGDVWTTKWCPIKAMYDISGTKFPLNNGRINFIMPKTSRLMDASAQELSPSYDQVGERLIVTFTFENGMPEDYSPYAVEWSTYIDKFNSMIDGFGFRNPSLAPEVIQSFIDILVSLQVSPITPKVSDIVLAWIIYFLERDSKGLCGGMVDTAIDYFENPYKIPDGYTRLVDVPQSQIQDTIEDFQVAQFFDAHGLLKQLLLRLGNDPSGLLSLDDEVAWIKQQTNRSKPVKLIVIDPDFGFFSAHAVLAYDVLEEGNNVIIKLYGPNRPKEEQWIELAYNEFGNLEIVNDVYPVDGFDIARFASEDGPTSLDWNKVVEYIDTLITKLLERLKEEFGKALSLMLHSPAQLHVYNPHGDHVGMTPEGEEVEFDALYCIDSKGTQNCVIPNPEAGNYGIAVFGTDHGKFTLTVSSTFEEVTTNEEVISGEIQPDVTYYYDVDLADDGTFTILDITPNEGIPTWIIGVVVATIAIATVMVIVWRKRSSK